MQDTLYIVWDIIDTVTQIGIFFAIVAVASNIRRYV